MSILPCIDLFCEDLFYVNLVFVNLVYIHLVCADLVNVDIICVDIVYVELICVDLQDALLHTSAHLDGFWLANGPHLLAPIWILILDLTSLKYIEYTWAINNT